jgi:AcrR family transcriptional regulator
LQQAIDRAYGPRKLRYLSMMADLQAARGKPAEVVAALQAVIAAFEALPEGHRKHPRWKELAEKTRERLKKLQR